jgi:hypothetical protein
VLDTILLFSDQILDAGNYAEVQYCNKNMSEFKNSNPPQVSRSVNLLYLTDYGTFSQATSNLATEKSENPPVTGNSPGTDSPVAQVDKYYGKNLTEEKCLTIKADLLHCVQTKAYLCSQSIPMCRESSFNRKATPFSPMIRRSLRTELQPSHAPRSRFFPHSSCDLACAQYTAAYVSISLLLSAGAPSPEHATRSSQVRP